MKMQPRLFRINQLWPIRIHHEMRCLKRTRRPSPPLSQPRALISTPTQQSPASLVMQPVAGALMVSHPDENEHVPSSLEKGSNGSRQTITLPHRLT